MADNTTVHIGENSPEHVALKLLDHISHVERKSLSATEPSGLKEGWTKADRAWILNTYGKCIRTVKTGYYDPA
jgi:hypothetical protein